MKISKEHRDALNEALDETAGYEGDVYVFDVKHIEILRSAVIAMLEDDEQIAPVAPAVGVQPVAILTREQIERIAHECETECHAVPGTTMYMCAEMAAEATLEAIASRVAQRADAQPVAWLVTSKRGLVRVAWTDKPTPEQLAVCEFDGDTVTPLYTSAQSKGLRKDAERYRWLVERFTGYDFDWMPSEPDADDGKSVVVFNVGREFRGGRDITAAIDAALSQHKAGEKDD